MPQSAPGFALEAERALDAIRSEMHSPDRAIHRQSRRDPPGGYFRFGLVVYFAEKIERSTESAIIL
jgi:hypothetical protein